jgi:hypothetical protein
MSLASSETKMVQRSAVANKESPAVDDSSVLSSGLLNQSGQHTPVKPTDSLAMYRDLDQQEGGRDTSALTPTVELGECICILRATLSVNRMMSEQVSIYRMSGGQTAVMGDGVP